MTPLDKLRIEYARQIIERIRDPIYETEADKEWIVCELLSEWGVKAYRRGQEHMAERLTKYVAGFLPPPPKDEA